MPRTNSIPSDDLAERLKTLPKEVQAGLRTLPVDQQREYLDSLDRLEGMAEKGQTFVPEMSPADAPYGYTKSGKPKAKPGKKPAEHPGARTKERPERFCVEDPGWEQFLAELPYDDDTDDYASISYSANYGSTTPTPEAPPRRPTEAEREVAEREKYQAELAAALEAAGRTTTGRDVLTPQFTRQKRIDPIDPDDPLAVATVETRTYRVTGDDREYHLEQLSADDTAWQTVSSSYGVDGLALHWAVNQIVVENFGELILGLPRHRPKHQERVDRLTTPAPRLSPEEREKARSDLRAEMARQHAARRDTTTGSWLDR
jgi:hypothetical protein